MEGLEDSLFLDPPDPVDLLIAHTEDGSTQPKPLDFVRHKMQELKKDNRRLKERVADLEQTLTIVQTAQEWTMGKGMTPEQADRLHEIKALLEQAQRARQELQNSSGSSKAALFEKLKTTRNQLKREKDDKREMRERLVQAFHHARVIQEENRRLMELMERERQSWTDRVRDMKERHGRELRRLHGEAAAHESDRHDLLSHFGEQVMGDLSALQAHLREVKQETVDGVVVAGQPYPDYTDVPPDDAGGDDYYGDGFDDVPPGKDVV